MDKFEEGDSCVSSGKYLRIAVVVVGSNSARANGTDCYYFLDEKQNMMTLELSLDEHPRLNHGCVLGEGETK